LKDYLATKVYCSCGKREDEANPLVGIVMEALDNNASTIYSNMGEIIKRFNRILLEYNIDDASYRNFAYHGILGYFLPKPNGIPLF
jgi:hypothetical protein